MKKQTEYINFDGLELEVDCYYEEAEKETYDYHGSDAYYNIDEVRYKGVEVSELLEEFCEDWMERINEKLLNN